jgi:hypothetical protein
MSKDHLGCPLFDTCGEYSTWFFSTTDDYEIDEVARPEWTRKTMPLFGKVAMLHFKFVNEQQQASSLLSAQAIM